MRPVIEIENLTKYYGKHRGIEHLNLVVDEGEFFGFIGRTERERVLRSARYWGF